MVDYGTVGESSEILLRGEHKRRWTKNLGGLKQLCPIE